MNDEIYRLYLLDFISLLKEQARETAKEANDPKTETEFNSGILMGYVSVIRLLKHQAIVFNIEDKNLKLDDIDPDELWMYYGKPTKQDIPEE